MSSATSIPASCGRAQSATRDPRWLQALLVAVSVSFLGLFLVLPLAAVFSEALGRGLTAYFQSFRDPAALAAIQLTLLTTAIAVPANLVFGVAGAWAIAKFEFRGKSLLITLIDLPFAVSPVISGLIYVLLFGMQGWFGPWLAAHDLKIIYCPHLAAQVGRRAGRAVASEGPATVQHAN